MGIPTEAAVFLPEVPTFDRVRKALTIETLERGLVPGGTEK
jgi:hypothetical protein